MAVVLDELRAGWALVGGLAVSVRADRASRATSIWRWRSMVMPTPSS
jgi:hypothetical protein